jgi:hypothetical protein
MGQGSSKDLIMAKEELMQSEGPVIEALPDALSHSARRRP